jgi:hypothetical protein
MTCGSALRRYGGCAGGGKLGASSTPKRRSTMRSIVLWALGVPLGLIVLLNLFNVI